MDRPGNVGAAGCHATPSSPASIRAIVGRVIPAFLASSSCDHRRRIRATAMFAPRRMMVSTTAAGAASGRRFCFGMSGWSKGDGKIESANLRIAPILCSNNGTLLRISSESLASLCVRASV